MKAISLTLLVSLWGLFLPACSNKLSAEPIDSSAPPPVEFALAQGLHGEEIVSPEPVENVRGWDYLANKLIAEGLSPDRVLAIFRDARIPEYTPIPFKLKPRETHAMYSSFTMPSRLVVARNYLNTHKDSFELAEQHFRVSKQVLAALLLVETLCGQVTGDHIVLYRLARVSSAAEPKNVDYNYEQMRQQDPVVARTEVEARARYLERTFYPEVVALFQLSEQHSLDLLSLKGSYAGAFGIPQFLPSSFLKFAVDGNADGLLSLYDPIDAISSAAHYLSAHGWDDNASIADKKKVLWNYNRSDAYGEAVIKVSILLRQPPVPAKRSPAKRRTHS